MYTLIYIESGKVALWQVKESKTAYEFFDRHHSVILMQGTEIIVSKNAFTNPQ
jgi:hypothetical protein